MKNPIILLISLFFATFIMGCYAKTCPRLDEFGANHQPPAGWKMLIPPVIADSEYYFGQAVHSLNGSFYYKQIICKYEACPTAFCPAFTIISTETFELPNTRKPPWHYPPIIAGTLTCRPADHSPLTCSFS